MCKITIIAAVSKNDIIGNGNAIPWKLPTDLQNFRRLTNGGVVVMGRKTYESIGKPLPNRHNVVISSNSALPLPEGVTLCLDAKAALKASRVLCMTHNIQDIWIIGGAGIYQQFLKRADKMFLTVIDKDCGGDTLFPQFKRELWELKEANKYSDPQGYLLEKPEELGLDYTIEEYERIF
jgi:dihydrofolate reductase